MTKPAKTEYLDQMERQATVLVKLLKDREAGLLSWNLAVEQTLDHIHQIHLAIKG